MAKNQVQFQKGLSLPEFFAAYGSETQCAETLFKWRWPQGFVCPECGYAAGYSEVKTRGLLQCKHCRDQTSLTAGTLFAATKLPLTTWFLAMCLLPQHKNAVSALTLKRQLGVSYNTAWSLKHKLMQSMLERDAREDWHPRRVDATAKIVAARGAVVVKIVVASTHLLNFYSIMAATLLQALRAPGGVGVGAGCRAVGRSLRTAPSLPSPRAGSRSFVLAPLRVAAGAPP